MQEDKNQSGKQSNTDPANAPEKKQEQSDPQLTELKGFVDPSEDLEPTLTTLLSPFDPLVWDRARALELFGTVPLAQLAAPAAALARDDTPMLPNSQWRVHDSRRPQSRVVTPGTASTPESPAATRRARGPSSSATPGT